MIDELPMIEALFSQPSYVATKKMMDATAMRHAAIASNLAHIETPNYKRIDVASDFSAQLRTAMGTQDVNRIASVQPSLVEDSTATSATKDGNNVQLETELMSLNENTVAHALETQLASGTLLKLRLAITGRNA